MNKQNSFHLVKLYIAMVLLFVQKTFAANFSIVPYGALPTTVAQGQTVQAYFTITNNSHGARNGYSVVGLPKTVTQNSTADYCTNPINLAANPASCILRLDITGAVHSGFSVCNGSNCTTASVPINVTSVSTPQRAKSIIVGDITTNHVLSFPATGNGNIAPTTDLGGNNTDISVPYGLYFDPSTSQLWVSNSTSNSISQFNFPVSGNITPSVVIEGASTTLNGPVGTGKDVSGNLYVANYLADTISVFPSGSQGDQIPSNQITAATSVYLASPTYIWITTTGGLMVANQGLNPYTPSVVEFAQGASGEATPIRNIVGANTTLGQPAGLWVDISGNIWVSDNYNQDIVEFSPDANGDVAPIKILNNSLISQPFGLAVDQAGYIYVACCNGGGGYILVFDPTSTGNAAPIQLISGMNTGLVCPQGLTIEP